MSVYYVLNGQYDTYTNDTSPTSEANNLCLFFLPFSSLSVFLLVFPPSVDFLLHLFSTSSSFFSFSLSHSLIRSLLSSSVHQLSWHLFSPLHLFYHPALFHPLSSLILTCEGTCGSRTERFCSLRLTLMTFSPPGSSAASTEVYSRSNFFEYFQQQTKGKCRKRAVGDVIDDGNIMRKTLTCKIKQMSHVPPLHLRLNNLFLRT